MLFEVVFEAAVGYATAEVDREPREEILPSPDNQLKKVTRLFWVLKNGSSMICLGCVLSCW